VSPNDWAGLAVAVISIVAGFAGAVRWLVKHYLAELKPNGGGSMNDRMTRLENRVDDIYNILLEK
jgi:hypothetical protein